MNDRQTTFRFEEFVLIPASKLLRGPGGKVYVRPKTHALLVYLVTNRHRTVRREEILEHVWPGRKIESQGVFQSISELRAIFGHRPFIRTVRGVGYQWTAPTIVRAEAVDSGGSVRWIFPALRVGTIVAAVCLALIGLRSLDLSTDDDRAPNVTELAPPAKLLTRAREHIAAGEFGPAARILSAILDANPDHLSARIDLAYVRMEQGQIKRAERLAKQVHQSALDHGADFIRMSSALLMTKLQPTDHDAHAAAVYAREAAEIAERLQLPAHSGFAYEQLGNISLQSGQYDLAITHLNKAREFYGNACPASEVRVQRKIATLSWGS